MRLVGDARYCASRSGYVDFRTCNSQFRRGAWCVFHFSRGSDRSFQHAQHQHSPAPSPSPRSDDVQPTAILGAMGMIATLMLLWVGIAASLPG